MVINEHWHHYQCQRLAEKVGVYPDPERKLSAVRCLFMSHHKHWCFKRIRQLSFHRGNEGTTSERGTRWLREIKSLRAVKVFSACKMSWLKCDHLLFKVTSKVIYCGYKQATGYNPYHKLLQWCATFLNNTFSFVPTLYFALLVSTCSKQRRMCKLSNLLPPV